MFENNRYFTWQEKTIFWFLFISIILGFLVGYIRGL